MIFSMILTMLVSIPIFINKTKNSIAVIVLLFLNILIVNFIAYNLLAQKSVVLLAEHGKEITYQTRPNENWFFGLGSLSIYKSTTKAYSPFKMAQDSYDLNI